MQSLILGVDLSGRSSCIGHHCVRWPQVIVPCVGIIESRTRAKSIPTTYDRKSLAPKLTLR
jgi:hypothetical protein